MHSINITRTLPLLAIALASCRKSPKPTPETTTTLFPADATATPKGVYVLNEGNLGSNKASLDRKSVV